MIPLIQRFAGCWVGLALAEPMAVTASPVSRTADTPTAVVDPAYETPAAQAGGAAGSGASRYALATSSTPPEPRIAGRPRTGKGMMIAGGATLGVGVVLAAVFGGVTQGCRDDGPLQCRAREQDTVLLPLGLTFAAAGVMLLAVGGAYLGRYRRWQRAASLAVVPASGRVHFPARFE